MTSGFTTHESSHGRKQKRTLNTPVSPWEISGTYSGLQVSVILMNTPQNLVSGDNISQDNSKEPTQLDRDCTPRQTGDRSSDPWTRRDLSYPGDVNLKLTNVPTSPCYAILMMIMIIPCTVNCLTCFVSAQVNQLQHAVPVQQRYKTTANHGIYHTPLDTAIRALRIETSKRGRPNTPHHPGSAGSSQKDLDAPIPKELGLPSLEGGMLGR